MSIIINGLLTAIGAGILTVVVLMIKWIWKKFRADDLTIKALAHDAYFRHARYLLNLDIITEDDFENHEYLWQAYKGQGLNGTGEQLHKQILKKTVTNNQAP